jgi:hypothetical protein
MSKKFKFLQLFGRLNELVSQKEHKTQQVFLPKSKIYHHNFDNYFSINKKNNALFRVHYLLIIYQILRLYCSDLR